MSEHWLSIVEYARRHNISDMTVRRRIKNGRLQAILRDGKYYISERRDGMPPRVSPATPAELVTSRPESVEAKVAARYLPPPPQHPISREASVPTFHVDHVPTPPVRNEMPQRHEFSQGSHLNMQRPSASAEWPVKNSQNYRSHESINPQFIPKDLANQVQNKQTALIETRSLLSFCDQTLRKLQSKERRTEELYQQKIKTLEAQAESKDLEIKILKEQVEDLELLVQVLEKKSA